MAARKVSMLLRLLTLLTMIYCCVGATEQFFKGKEHEVNSSAICSKEVTKMDDLFEISGCIVLFRTSDCSLRGYIVQSKEHLIQRSTLECSLHEKGGYVMVELKYVNSLRNCTEWENTANAFQVGINEYPTQPHHSTRLREVFPHLSKNKMETFVRNLSSFQSRHSQYYDDADTAEGWINQQIRAIVDSYTGGSISVQKVASPGVGNVRAYNQENVVVKLEGNDPTLKSELVILGAHYDSINAKPDKDRVSGADDNATGCAVLLEVLRLISRFGIKFKHSVEFHFYAAEEKGLWGSQDVVEQYLINKTMIKGMLSLDTLGYQSSQKQKTIEVKTDENDPKLTAFVRMLIRHYLPDYRMIDCLGCSSWNLDGYPTAYVAAAELSQYLHSSRDTIDKVNFEQVKEFAKLAVAFASELGELAEISNAPDASSSSIPSKDWGAIMIGLAVFFCFWRGVNY